MVDGKEVESSESQPMNIVQALKVVVNRALAYDGLSRGLRETVKAIECREVRVVLLAEDCSEDRYKNLIKALCAEAKIPLINVPTRVELGEWAGLHRYKKSGKKEIAASVIAIRQFGEKSDSLTYVQNYIKKGSN